MSPDDSTPRERRVAHAQRWLRLLKLLVTTLAALVGIAKALGLL